MVSENVSLGLEDQINKHERFSKEKDVLANTLSQDREKVKERFNADFFKELSDGVGELTDTVKTIGKIAWTYIRQGVVGVGGTLQLSPEDRKAYMKWVRPRGKKRVKELFAMSISAMELEKDPSQIPDVADEVMKHVEHSVSHSGSGDIHITYTKAA